LLQRDSLHKEDGKEL